MCFVLTAAAPLPSHTLARIVWSTLPLSGQPAEFCDCRNGHHAIFATRCARPSQSEHSCGSGPAIVHLRERSLKTLVCWAVSTEARTLHHCRGEGPRNSNGRHCRRHSVEPERQLEVGSPAGRPPTRRSRTPRTTPEARGSSRAARGRGRRRGGAPAPCPQAPPPGCPASAARRCCFAWPSCDCGSGEQVIATVIFRTLTTCLSLILSLRGW